MQTGSIPVCIFPAMLVQIFTSLLIVVLAMVFTAGYYYLGSYCLDTWGKKTNSPLPEQLKPWLFLFPALFLLFAYLIYPFFETLRLSFFDSSGDTFVGLANYIWLAKSDEVIITLRNNLLWLLVVPTLSTFFGLIIAALADRVWWGTIAKTLIFLPMAISFVGASVIWKFVYDLRPGDIEQIGLLNAIVAALGGEPQAWITVPFWNNFFLMIILIWIQTGFAMVILSAAIRGISTEVIEAAQLEGANGIQIFIRIIVPQIIGTIMVVWTTITIIVLKIFDIVAAMTNGQWDTEVLANLMFDWMFTGGSDFGRGSVIALLIMIGVIPVMIWNIHRLRKEEAVQ